MKLIIRKDSFFVFIIWSFFILEKQILNIAGGNFKVYFIFAILAIGILIKSIGAIASTKTFALSVFYTLSMVISSMLSELTFGALKNSLASFLYIMVAYAIALILVSNKINAIRFQNILYTILVSMMLFGLFQYFLFRVTHIAFYDPGGLGSSQISGLSTEPNGHGKAVGAALLICIPVFLSDADKRQKRKYIFLLLCAGSTFIISMTRNVFYCLIVTGVFLIPFYLSDTKKRKRYFVVLILAVIVFVGLYALIVYGYIHLDGRTLEKFHSLFLTSRDELLDDGSGRFRLPALLATISAWLKSAKTFFFGCGPGQAYAVVTTFETRVSGNGIINNLPGIGLIGVIFYSAMLIVPILQSFRAARILKNISDDIQIVLLAEQSFVLSIYVFVMDFIATSYYYAQMWVVVALGMFWEIYLRRIRKSMHDKRLE